MEYKIYIYDDYKSLNNEIINLLKNENYQHIIFNNIYFNNPIDNLPNNIKIIEFNKKSEFNHQLNNLPIELEHLWLGINYQYNLDNLPINLKSLKLIGYNGSYDNLPYGLLELQILEPYKLLSNNINNLKFDMNIHLKGINNLNLITPKLEILRLSNYTSLDYFINLPLSLKKLYLAGNCNFMKDIKTLPPLLEIFYIIDDYNLKLFKYIQSIYTNSIKKFHCYDLMGGGSLQITKDEIKELKFEDDNDSNYNIYEWFILDIYTKIKK